MAILGRVKMSESPNILISKSRYLSGLRCDKLLWYTYHRKDLFPPHDKATLGRFTQGNEIGELATRRFPGGQEAAPGKYYAGDTVPSTKDLLGKRIPIFEAGFVHGAAYVLVDVLDPVDENQWDLYEVKSTTRYSPEKHLADVAIQKYTVEGNGLSVRNCYLMHVNNQYIRKGEVDPETLLTAEEITDDVDVFIDRLGGDLDRMLGIIQKKDCPEVAIGPHCFEIRKCDLCSVCWEAMPEHHPVTLYSGKKKGFELIARGINDLKDIGREVPLTGRQRIQVDAIRRGEAIVDSRQVSDFLASLEYPLSFLDFETLGSAVPLYNGTRPYQSIPFQYSLHVVTEPGAGPVHHAFLAEGPDDPRPSLQKALMEALPLTGSVLAYNASFEKGILRALADLDPFCRAWVEDVNPRVVDLLVPFQSFAVYHPAQHGSASMKNVLPALTGVNYEGIDMGGEEAGYEFIRVTYSDVGDEEVKTVRATMEEYCKLDTLGMIYLVETLQNLIES